ncbi:hypothetical protein IHQ68_13725 [Chelatococcus sambhunathii]|uniref:Uncharacterized protein n=1 Tax=Chelatococcus sambhunathii TaxID=363953 RepID=A0ABU1DHS0_9HYPH|nr:hypothetical protein [Chelatococcus sambhunathii]MDR4307677.1 hypothetical protein [Chelatococcus sambhunathii]
MPNLYHSPANSNGNATSCSASWPADPTSLAVHLIAARKRITLAHAATVAELAGIGPLHIGGR